MIRTKFARSSQAAIEYQGMRREKDAVVARMDQGSRGRPPAPQPQGNDAANAALRAMFRHEELDTDDRGATEA
jgi:hypothetical protein